MVVGELEVQIGCEALFNEDVVEIGTLLLSAAHASEIGVERGHAFVAQSERQTVEHGVGIERAGDARWLAG